MANYAVVPLSGGIVNNIVVGDSLEQVRLIVGDVVQITEETGRAGIGYTWDAERNAFIPPKPYDSWILNEDTYRWEPPVAYPEDGLGYDWNEETLSWETFDS
jgi:hypothetical protein